MRIANAFVRAREGGRKAFVAYLTAGDPSLAATARFVRVLERAGVDILELGVPHSDPVADGPTNLKAAERALKAGTTLLKILDLVKALRAGGSELPIVLFTYFNPLLRMGLERFASAAAESGVDGVLVVDLPPEEAEEYLRIMRGRKIDTIFLASPTTPADRIARVAGASSGFLYYVSVKGVTGVRKTVSATLADEVRALKRHTSLPVAVGFGISTPEQAREVAAIADAVVVGSALVKEIEASHSVEEAEGRLANLVKEMKPC